jgi:hypothetical protein
MHVHPAVSTNSDDVVHCAALDGLQLAAIAPALIFTLQRLLRIGGDRDFTAPLRSS